MANNPVKIMVIPRPLNPLGILEYLSLYLIVDITESPKNPIPELIANTKASKKV